MSKVFFLRFLKLFERYDIKKKFKITLKSPTELQVIYIAHVCTVTAQINRIVGKLEGRKVRQI